MFICIHLITHTTQLQSFRRKLGNYPSCFTCPEFPPETRGGNSVNVENYGLLQCVAACCSVLGCGNSAFVNKASIMNRNSKRFEQATKILATRA